MRKKKSDALDHCAIDPSFEGVPWVFSENLGISERGAELVLWRRVIILTLFDFCNTSENPVSAKQKRSAMNWFLRNKKDFTLVCELADIQPDTLRNLIRKANNNPRTMLPMIRDRLMRI